MGDDNAVELQIDDILLLDSLQQRKLGKPNRKINDDTMTHYASLMLDGVEFPPVEVVKINDDLCMVDGWHRLYAKKQTGAATIMAYVTVGTMQDAIMMSYAVNQAHGLPREKGVTQAIVERMLADPKCKKMSLSAIGRHVGCSHQYVGRVKSHLATSCKIESGTKEVTRNGTTYEQKTGNIGKKSKPRKRITTVKGKAVVIEDPPKRAPAPADSPPADPEELTMSSTGGQDAPSPDQPAKGKPAKAQRSKSKQVVPDCLSDFFKTSDQRANELNTALNGVLEALELIPDDEETNSWLQKQVYTKAIKDLIAEVKFSRPHAICVTCGGTTVEDPGRMKGACLACRSVKRMPKKELDKLSDDQIREAQKDMKGRGWINHAQWGRLSREERAEALKE